VVHQVVTRWTASY